MNTSAPAADDQLPASSVVLSAVTGVVVVCSLVGNLSVFLTISRSKTLQRVNNALVMSLAVADLLRSTTVVPLYAALLLVPVSPSSQHWLCPLYTAMLVSTEVAVILNVILISIERVIIITRPLLYQRSVTFGKVSVVIASLWIFSLVFGGLQTLRFMPEDEHISSVEFSSTVCFAVPSLGYAVFNVVLTLAFPVVTLVVCYGKIFVVVHSQMRRIVPRVSDTYGNSEAVFSYAEAGRQTFGTRSTSLSHRDSSTYEGRRVIEVTSSSVANPDNAKPSAYPGLGPLSNIEEDLIEGKEQSSNDGGTGGGLNILVTHSSRETVNIEPYRTKENHAVLSDVVPYSNDLELILSPTDLNRSSQNVVRSLNSDPLEANLTRTGTSKRGSSVTFNLRNERDITKEANNIIITTTSQTTEPHSNDDVTQTSGVLLQSVTHGESISLSQPATNGDSKGPPTTGTRRSSRGSATSRTSLNPSMGIRLARRNSIAKINDNKALKMAVVVVGAFLVCWTPSKICFLVRVTSDSLISDFVFDLMVGLSFVASALNPYVYNFYSAEFRRALKRALLCQESKPDMPWM